MSQKEIRSAASPPDGEDAAPQAGQRPARSEDREQFQLSRSAQLSVWSPELREIWRQDLLSALAEGRNLINEKYIYMLEQVSPEQYVSRNANLPAASMEKLWLVDWICQAQITWQKTLLRKYSHLTQNSRAIHRSADSQNNISFETYIRGELMTHSVNTLRLFAHQIEKSQKAGENLCENILKAVVQQLGYASLEAADNSIA